MNNTFLSFIVGVMALLFCTSCIPLPPWADEVAPSANGIVRDTLTHKPVVGARVTAERAGYRAHARTDRNGSFRIPPLQQWHYIVYLGSPGVFPDPWGLHTESPCPYVITTKAAGYDSITMSFEHPSGHHGTTIWDPPLVVIPSPIVVGLKPQ